MSEATTEPKPDDTGQQQQGDPEALGDPGKKALDAERTARAAAEKKAAELQKHLDDIAAASLTDLQRAQKEAADARDAGAKAATDTFRAAAIKFGGISAEDADLFLTGTDVETLERQAARLMERTPTPSAETAPAPRPDRSQGSKGQPATGSPAQDFANFLSGQLAQG